jgi:hydrogenase maturation protease
MLKFSYMVTDREARRDKTLLLGIGNEIRGDDGVGIHVVRRVRALLAATPLNGVDVEEACAGGFDLVDYLAGYGRAVIVDAVQTAGGAPGAVYTFDADALKPTAHLGHSHGVNLASALALLAALDMGAPRKVTVVAVEAERLYEFTEEMTPAVAAAVEAAAGAVLDELRAATS